MRTFQGRFKVDEKSTSYICLVGTATFVSTVWSGFRNGFESAVHFLFFLSFDD